MGAMAATLLQPLVIAQQVDSSLPKIISHPKDVETEISNDAVFSVVATNALSYQWVKDGHDLLWETNSAIRIDLARFYQARSNKCTKSNESKSLEIPSP